MAEEITLSRTDAECLARALCGSWGVFGQYAGEELREAVNHLAEALYGEPVIAPFYDDLLGERKWPIRG